MGMSALVSVIIPVFRVEEYLDQCVETVVGQTYRHLEIILVDDGSDDASGKMCDEWAEKDRRIHVIHKENGGLSDARNAGMAVASGDFISFVDSDDYLGPEMIERLLLTMEEDRSDIAACSVQMTDQDGTPGEYLTVRMRLVMDREQAQMALLTERELKQPVWYKMYRKEIVMDIPFEKGKFHEDVFWSYQAVARAQRVSLIEYTGYFYRQRKKSIMGAGYSLSRLDSVEARAQRQEYLEKEMPSLAGRARISLLFNCLYHGQQALVHLQGRERQQAMDFLEETIRKYPLTDEDRGSLRFARRIWADLARANLAAACRIRNLTGTGK